MYLNEKVRTIVGRGMHLTGQRVGIELEFEKYRRPRDGVDAQYWTTIPDGSLRDNGIEFVSCPLFPEDVREALKEANELIELTRVKATLRCGIHVHLNVGDCTMGQLWSLSALYVLLEPTLFAVWAPQRQHSHFCVPSFSNTVLTQAMFTDVMMLREEVQKEPAYDYDGEELEGETIMHIPPLKLMHANKYTALNYRRVGDLMTVEFRHLDATKDMNRVQQWIDLLLRIQSLANVIGDEPLDVLEMYNDKGLVGLCKEVGLEPCEVDPLDQADAEDVATFMCGYTQPKWEELQWQMEA